MSINRPEFAANVQRLRDNGHFRYYVSSVESAFNDAVTQLLLSDHPDEALRGEARAYMKLLKTLNSNMEPHK